jgi:hypothetical protein
MKVIPFPRGNKPYRILVPAKISATGKRQALYFRTREEADKKLKEIKRFGTSAINGAPSWIEKTEQDEFAIAVKRFAALYDGNPAKAFAAHERLVKLSKVKPATVREAVEAFQLWRATQAVTKSTIDADRWRLLKLIKAFSEIQLSDLTTVALREFFDEITGDPRSVYKSVRVFFGWALDRGYLSENPMATIEPVGEFGINNDFYSVETFHRMLTMAATFPRLRDLLPLFVVSGFLGLRSHEARRETRTADSIHWSDLHWTAEVPYVEIRATVAKGGKPRHIETLHYLEAAKVWLEFYGKPETDGPIVPWTKRQIQELKRDFKKATGLAFTENGFRNSFATYALHFNGLQGVGKLALEMGNSEAICKRHYIRTIAPGSGRAWFAIFPTQTRKIVPMVA